MIRRATQRDLSRLAALFAGLLSHHDLGDGRFERASDSAGAEDALRSLLAGRLKAQGSLVLLHEVEDGQLDGLCLSSLRVRPPLFEETRRGEIEQLVVRSEARRRGVGSALVEQACTWMRQAGAAAVDVQVARSNAEGQAFWRALGYVDSMDVLEHRL